MTLHWVLFGSRATGSSRIHGHRIHEELLRQGYDSQILVGPPQDVQRYDLPWHDPVPLAESTLFAAGDVVILETVRGPRAQAFAQTLRKRSVKVCFSECDLYPESEIVNHVDQLICTSEYLAKKYRECHLQVPTAVIPDAVEELLTEVELAERVPDRTKHLKLAWIGQGAHWETLGEIRDILREQEFQDLELTTVSNHPEATAPWSPEEASQVLRVADACLIPTGSTPQQLAKSSNRLVQGMALGAIPLAGAIPAYEEILKSGENGFLCRHTDDWRKALRQLRSVELRRGMVRAGWDLVSREFTIETITRRYVELLGLEPEEARPEKEWPRGYQGEMAADWGFWYLAQGRPSEAVGWFRKAVFCEPFSTGLGTLAGVACGKSAASFKRYPL
ncbi:MAG: glycosyltransferase [Planctomycetales bacterium]